MKKLSFLISVLLFSAASAFADVYTVCSGKAQVARDSGKYFSDQDITIKYDDEKKIYYLNTKVFISNIFVLLSENDLEKIRYALTKYKEWVKIAKEHNVEMDKEIPDSSIDTKVIWEYGEDKWHTASGFNLTLKAVSLNLQQHYFVISSNKVSSFLNEYITVKLDPLYFNEVNADALLDALQKEKIESVKEEYNKKKAAQDLFQ